MAQCIVRVLFPIPAAAGTDCLPSLVLKSPLALDQPMSAECRRCSELPSPPTSTAALFPGLPDRLPDHADLWRLPWL